MHQGSKYIPKIYQPTQNPIRKKKRNLIQVPYKGHTNIKLQDQNIVPQTIWRPEFVNSFSKI